MKRLLTLLVLLALAGALMACQGTLPVDVDAPGYSTGIDATEWALVPAGEFLMGQHEHRTAVDYDYEMMVTDVTNAHYGTYLNEALDAEAIHIVDGQIVGYYPGDTFDGYEHEEVIEAGDWLHVPLDNPDQRIVRDAGLFVARPGYEDHPMVYVSWFGAKAYCDFYGWRLPTEIEWEKAARGTDARAYPWGDDLPAGRANFYASRDPFEALLGKLGDTTPVGFYNGLSYDSFATLDSASPYGLYDMAGNVWQWTADDYPDQHYRYMRGGSRASYDYMLRVWARNSAGPDYVSPSVGFRCVR